MASGIERPESDIQEDRCPPPRANCTRASACVVSYLLLSLSLSLSNTRWGGGRWAAHVRAKYPAQTADSTSKWPRKGNISTSPPASHCARTGRGRNCQARPGAAHGAPARQRAQAQARTQRLRPGGWPNANTHPHDGAWPGRPPRRSGEQGTGHYCRQVANRRPHRLRPHLAGIFVAGHCKAAPASGGPLFASPAQRRRTGSPTSCGHPRPKARRGAGATNIRAVAYSTQE